MKELRDLKCFLFDLDGTVYLADKLFPKAKETLNYLKSHARVMYITNNSSVSRKNYVKKLTRLGIDARPDDIYSSTLSTVDYLKANMPGVKVSVFGTPDLKEEIAECGIRIDEERPDLVLLGFKTDASYADLKQLCKKVSDGVPYIATHDDTFCPMPDGPWPDAGSFIAMVKAVTGRDPVCICGKPYGPMVDGVTRVSGVEASSIAMVGDRLATDMEFAMQSPLTGILVLTGVTTRQDAENYRLMPDYIFEDIAALGDAVKKDFEK